MIGQTFGNHRILDKLGAGGMGVVYRARDEVLHREVAIKVLPPEKFADDAARSRLLREARTASALNHPHICTIHEVGEVGGQTYIVMELIKGRSLSHVIGSEGLPHGEVVRYAKQMADALAHAHELEVIHRDLKTSNVMVTAEGRIKVLDFGLAKRRVGGIQDGATQSDLTQAGSVAGTLHYIAPEVLRGSPADVRSDLWALGVMLHEMLAGVRPFAGDTGFEVTSAILRDAPPALPEDVPPALRAVVLRCLEKDPARRYQRAGEVLAALEAADLSASAASLAAQAEEARRLTMRVATRRRLLVAGVVVAALAVLLVVNPGGWRERLFSVGSGNQVDSLAVLPLRNLSGDAAQDYLVDGMTELLIGELSRLEGVRVISTASVMRYKGEQKPIRDVARDLRVDAVVEGSVLRQGEKLRVSAQLVRASTGESLWAETFDRDAREILAVQSELARAIAGRVKTSLTPRERHLLEPGPNINPDAHDAYLKGLHHWNRRTIPDLNKAVNYFQQALLLEPKFALAYLGLANSYVVLASSASVVPEDAHRTAETAAVRALEINPELGEAHATLANIRFANFEWAEAEAEFRKAIDLRPNFATARHWFALFLAGMGRHTEAAAEINRARELDPLSLIINANRSWCSYLAGEYDRGIRECRETLDLDPNFAAAHGYLGQNLVELGRFDEAIAALQKAADMSGGEVGYTAELANALASVGKTTEALKLLRRLEDLAGREPVSPYQFAMVYAGLGDKDQALLWLEKSVENRDARLANLRVHPRFAALRAEARFKKILARMNLTP